MAPLASLPNELLDPVVKHVRDQKIDDLSSVATRDLQNIRVACRTACRPHRDYDPEGDESEDFEEGDRDSDSADGMSNEDEQIPSEEMVDASEESYQNEWNRSKENAIEYKPIDLPHSEPKNQGAKRWANFGRKRKLCPL